jgi:hypothetical protein
MRTGRSSHPSQKARWMGHPRIFPWDAGSRMTGVKLTAAGRADPDHSVEGVARGEAEAAV